MKDIKQNNRRYADNFSQERARKACFDNEIKCQVYRFGEVFKIDDEIIAKECDQKAMINYVDNSIKFRSRFQECCYKKRKEIFFIFLDGAIPNCSLCGFLGRDVCSKGNKNSGKSFGRKQGGL
ncbi:MAG: hypothetical protein UR65_C0008G0002 [Candidatus Moranbacteria bacterium GW2011_GWE2_35_164]|nr:MAG: hypothetical protein UR65_C0008G0002 [Candidatus Moranbacteria bacterium GW2011_GWE2_35_164]